MERYQDGVDVQGGEDEPLVQQWHEVNQEQPFLEYSASNNPQQHDGHSTSSHEPMHQMHQWHRMMTGKWQQHAVMLHHQSEQPGGIMWDVDGAHIGQYVGLDRYVTLYHLLAWGGHPFRKSWILGLYDKAMKEQDVMHITINAEEVELVYYPPGSKALELNEEIDGFISYRWETGRFGIYLAFCGHFAMHLVMIVIVVLYPIVMFILSFGVCPDLQKPHYYVNDGGVQVLRDYLVLPFIVCKWSTLGTVAGSGDVSSNCQPFIFQVLGVFMLLPMMFYFAQVSNFSRKYWLDRFCLCQTSSHQMRRGLSRLLLYLAQSKVLYSFFDHQYATRLWCMVELSVYCAVRTDPKVVFVAVDQHRAGMLCLLVATVFGLAFGIYNYVSVITMFKGEDLGPGNQIVLWCFGLAGEIILRTILFYCGRRLFNSLDRLSEAQETFDVRQCELGMEEDRFHLLQLINEALFLDTEGSATVNQIPLEVRVRDPDAVDAGLDFFNDFIKQNLQEHFPIHGLKTCMILTYSHAFLVAALWALLGQVWYDGSFFWNLDYNSVFKFHAYDLVGYFWVCFVMQPLNMYALGAFVKFFWWAEKRVRIHWVFTFILFLFFDMICAVRPWIFYLSTNGFVNQWSVPGVSGFMAAGIKNHKWNIYPSPFNFMPDVILTYFHPKWLLSEHRFYNYVTSSYTFSGQNDNLDVMKFSSNPVQIGITYWSVAFIWIWVVVTSLFTYYVYEPALSRHYRGKLWSWCKARVKA